MSATPKRFESQPRKAIPAVCEGATLKGCLSHWRGQCSTPVRVDKRPASSSKMICLVAWWGLDLQVQVGSVGKLFVSEIHANQICLYSRNRLEARPMQLKLVA